MYKKESGWCYQTQTVYEITIRIDVEARRSPSTSPRGEGKGTYKDIIEEATGRLLYKGCASCSFKCCVSVNGRWHQPLWHREESSEA